VGDPQAATSYEVIGKLADGDVAELFLAKAAGALERLVVVKRIPRRVTQNVELMKMFLDEARIAARLQHPNIAQVFEVGKLGGSYFFSMEYINGETLRALVEHARAKKIQVPIRSIVTIAAGAVAGLHHAHERTGLDGKPMGIVHADVSPTNLLVSREGIVKLVDFGIAKARGRSHLQTPVAKISYWSPEQCRSEALDRRSDLFSLGVVLWELITLEDLFHRGGDAKTRAAIENEEAPPPSARRYDVPPELDAIIQRMLAKNPADRFPTADDVLAALEGLASKLGFQLSTAELARMMRLWFGNVPDPVVPASDQPLVIKSEPVTQEIAAAPAADPIDALLDTVRNATEIIRAAAAVLTGGRADKTTAAPALSAGVDSAREDFAAVRDRILAQARKKKETMRPPMVAEAVSTSTGAPTSAASTAPSADTPAPGAAASDAAGGRAKRETLNSSHNAYSFITNVAGKAAEPTRTMGITPPMGTAVAIVSAEPSAPTGERSKTPTGNMAGATPERSKVPTGNMAGATPERSKVPTGNMAGATPAEAPTTGTTPVRSHTPTGNMASATPQRARTPSGSTFIADRPDGTPSAPLAGPDTDSVPLSPRTTTEKTPVVSDRSRTPTAQGELGKKTATYAAVAEATAADAVEATQSVMAAATTSGTSTKLRDAIAAADAAAAKAAATSAAKAAAATAGGAAPPDATSAAGAKPGGDDRATAAAVLSAARSAATAAEKSASPSADTVKTDGDGAKTAAVASDAAKTDVDGMHTAAAVEAAKATVDTATTDVDGARTAAAAADAKMTVSGSIPDRDAKDADTKAADTKAADADAADSTDAAKDADREAPRAAEARAVASRTAVAREPSESDDASLAPKRPAWLLPVGIGAAALLVIVIFAMSGSDDKPKRQKPQEQQQVAVIADAAIVAPVVTVDAADVATMTPDAAQVAAVPVDAAVATAPVDAATQVASATPDAAVKPKEPVDKPKDPVDKPKDPVDKPKDPVDKPKDPVDKPPPVSSQTIEELVSAGEFGKANKACKTNTIFNSTRLTACTIAACNVKDQGLAKRWIRAIEKSARPDLIKTCGAMGVTIEDPSAPTPPAPTPPAP
jgi:hypothetical protein